MLGELLEARAERNRFLDSLRSLEMTREGSVEVTGDFTWAKRQERASRGRNVKYGSLGEMTGDSTHEMLCSFNIPFLVIALPVLMDQVDKSLKCRIIRRDSPSYLQLFVISL